jgi:hypothetical protein
MMEIISFQCLGIPRMKIMTFHFLEDVIWGGGNAALCNKVISRMEITSFQCLGGCHLGDEKAALWNKNNVSPNRHHEFPGVLGDVIGGDENTALYNEKTIPQDTWKLMMSIWAIIIFIPQGSLFIPQMASPQTLETCDFHSGDYFIAQGSIPPPPDDILQKVESHDFHPGNPQTLETDDFHHGESLFPPLSCVWVLVLNASRPASSSRLLLL